MASQAWSRGGQRHDVDRRLKHLLGCGYFQEFSFDLKRRRRHAALTSHDIRSAARRAQANADAGSGVGPTPAAGAASDKVSEARITLHAFIAPHWLSARSYSESWPAGGEPGFDGEPAAARWKSTRAAGMRSCSRASKVSAWASAAVGRFRSRARGHSRA